MFVKFGHYEGGERKNMSTIKSYKPITKSSFTLDKTSFGIEFKFTDGEVYSEIYPSKEARDKALESLDSSLNLTII